MRTDDQNVPLPLRSYTLLGVCEAIGEDFGFNANYLRVPLGAVVVLNIWAAVGAYLALGLVVLASRILFPRAKAEEASAPVQQREAANRDFEDKIAA